MERKCHFRIYWKTRNREAVRQIRLKFGMPFRTTVNGETEADIGESLIPLLEETARRGFIEIRARSEAGRETGGDEEKG